MNTIELFSGTQSFSKVMRKHNHNTYCIDNDPQFNNDYTVDILDLTVLDFIGHFDMLWASPPCQAFSVATIGRNWNKKDKTPKTDKAKLGLKLLERTIQLIKNTEPKLWYIENPRGMMRVVIDKLFEEYNIKNVIRHTVTYCQYGDDRMKPTDIWTNDIKWKPKKPCKNGMSCHISAPRGSKTGTQGLKDAIQRAVIPEELFEEILKHRNRINIEKQTRLI